MKIFNLILLFTIFFGVTTYAQKNFPIEFRVEKQSMSTPMSTIEEIFFNSAYYARPVNVKFDGVQLNIYFDNNATFLKDNVTEVASNADFDDDEEFVKRHYYTLNSNVSDTIMLVVDYEVPYIQLVLTTKNSKGEKIGYTSFQKFVKHEELASR